MTSLQSTILDIYREVSRICDENDIRYFAIGGTAIGTARHQGFIPWDDDLDIAVPIEDFERLKSLLSSELPGYYRYVCGEGSPHYTSFLVKIDDVRTTQIQADVVEWPDRYTGAWLDIMPMSGVPSGHVRQRLYSAAIKLLLSLNVKARTPCKVHKGLAGLRDLVLCLFARVISSIFGLNCFENWWERLLRAHRFDCSDYTGYTWSNALSKLIFPRDWFSDYVLMPFEDTRIRMPVGWREYLTQQFGDYMQLPPPEKRETHECFVDLDHSFRDYQMKTRRLPEELIQDSRGRE